MNFNHFNSLKVYVLNLTTFGITLTNTSEYIKVLVLLATLIFTIVKTVDILRKMEKKKK